MRDNCTLLFSCLVVIKLTCFDFKIKGRFDYNSASILKIKIRIFHIHTVHRDTIKVSYSPTNAQVIVLKTVLKFTLK